MGIKKTLEHSNSRSSMDLPEDSDATLRWSTPIGSEINDSCFVQSPSSSFVISNGLFILRQEHEVEFDKHKIRRIESVVTSRSSNSNISHQSNLSINSKSPLFPQLMDIDRSTSLSLSPPNVNPSFILKPRFRCERLVSTICSISLSDRRDAK